MEFAGFTKGEIEDRTLQQRIRRLITKKQGKPETPPPPSAMIISTLVTFGPPSSTMVSSTTGRADRADRRDKRKDTPATDLHRLHTALALSMHSSSKPSTTSSEVLAQLKEKGKHLQQESPTRVGSSGGTNKEASVRRCVRNGKAGLSINHWSAS
jgi:hypothetical protein